MPTQAKWGSLKFAFTDKSSALFSDATYTGGYVFDEKEKKKKKNRLKKKGAERRKLSIGHTVSAYTGTDVRKRIEKIMKMAEKGKAYNFYIGGKRLGKNKMVLTDVSAPVDVTARGKMYHAEISLTFEESPKK